MYVLTRLGSLIKGHVQIFQVHVIQLQWTIVLMINFIRNVLIMLQIINNLFLKMFQGSEENKSNLASESWAGQII